MHGNTCIELFGFAVNSISSKNSQINIILRLARLVQCCNQRFFGHTGTCAEAGTLMEVLESAPSDRQTNKSFGSI